MISADPDRGEFIFNLLTLEIGPQSRFLLKKLDYSPPPEGKYGFMDRKTFFSSGIKELLGDLLQSPVGKIVDNRLEKLTRVLTPFENQDLITESQFSFDYLGGADQEKRILPRPPGALADPVAFKKACTLCGDCIAACPYGTLYSMSGRSGPVLDPNYISCDLCSDYPCIAACKEGALRPLPKGVYPKFGQARLLGENCMNYPEHRERKKRNGAKRVPYCRECKNACPVEGALAPNSRKMPGFTEDCAGCGLCAQACPALPRAIEIDWPGRREPSGP